MGVLLGVIVTLPLVVAVVLLVAAVARRWSISSAIGREPGWGDGGFGAGAGGPSPPLPRTGGGGGDDRLAGVREPRRPVPSVDSAADALEPPEDRAA